MPPSAPSALAEVALALVVVFALVAAACGGNRSTAKPASTTAGSTTPGGTETPSTIIDTSTCPPGSDTTGVTGDTITIGTSLPQSGLYAAFSAILDGEQAYIDYTNANGGVTVAGKKYQIKLVAKDDAYVASKTVTNVQSLLTDDHVFALLNVVGTKNNLAIRDLVNRECVPDLFAASGATQWGNHKFPWLIGSELVPYPLEVKTFVDYLKADQARRDDRGAEGQRRLRAVVRRHAHPAREGHEAQGRADPAVRQHRRGGQDAGEQPRRHAGRRVPARRALLACPAALTRRRRGLAPDHLHVGHVRVEGALQHRRTAGQRRVQCHAAARPGRPRQRKATRR